MNAPCPPPPRDARREGENHQHSYLTGMDVAILSPAVPWSEIVLVATLEAIRRLARSPTILQAHLAQLAGISLRLGDCECHRTHSADFPLLTRGRAMFRIHKCSSDSSPYIASPQL